MEDRYGLGQLPASEENAYGSQIIEFPVLIVLSRSDRSIRTVLFEAAWSILPRYQLNRL